MKKRILCFGDSNTWGYVPGCGKRYSEEERWPCICQKILGDEYTIIEDGINGRTTCFDKGWGDCKNGRTGLGYALLTSYPIDAIVIMLGTNDLTEKDAVYAMNGVDELIRIATHADSYFRVESPIFVNGPKVLLVAPPLLNENCDNGFVLPFVGKYEESKKFGRLYEVIAKKRNVDFLDAAEYTNTPDIDCIHLDKDSHYRLGVAVAEKIKNML